MSELVDLERAAGLDIAGVYRAGAVLAQHPHVRQLTIRNDTGLQHVRDLGPRLTPEARSAIMTIKRAWVDRPEYRKTVSSFEIYMAVFDHGVRTPDEFVHHLRSK